MAVYKTLVHKVAIPSEKKTKQKNYKESGKLAIVDQGRGMIGGYTDDVGKCLPCNLPVIVFGDHTCAVKYIDFPFGAGADGIKVLEPCNSVLPKYLYYGTLYLVCKFPDKGYARHYQHIEKMQLIVPSLPEQERIVARIEELFSELDKAVETLQTTKRQLEVYRQAVLKEVFGTVTQYVPLGTVSESRLGKMLDKKKNIGTYRQYLRNQNVRWFSIDESDLLEMRFEDRELEKYSLKVGDLVICEGGEPGRCAVWDKDESICYQKALHRVRFYRGANPKLYMYYFWFLAQTGELGSYYTGTGINHLTGESLVKVCVPDIEVEQQTRLVEIIESRLSVCDSIEQTVDTALSQADALRQSILKEAFEGRLA